MKPRSFNGGLSQTEAETRLQTIGPNELPSAKPRSVFDFLFQSIREPMVLLLIACATIYFFIGESQDSVLLLISVFAVIAISFFQEYKSGRALETLRDLSSPRALVVRDGEPRRIAGREVVPGDLLLLAEGDRIAADGVLVKTANLQTDESLLTGESLPVDKDLTKSSTDLKVFASTLVTSGSGSAYVTQTGPKTEIGKIGKSLNQAPEVRTRLQSEMNRIVRVFGTIGVLASAIITAAYVFSKGEWAQGLLAGLAAAMALLPEEFPVILTVFLALGAWRLAKVNVLVRQAASTENLGAVTALCVDKTGTLTMNEMAVSQIRTLDENWTATVPTTASETIRRVLEHAELACRKTEFDPMEKAIHRAANVFLDHKVQDDFEAMSREYPLSPQRMAMSCAWRKPSSQIHIVATKGAPEAIMQLCRVGKVETARIMKVVQDMSESGVRIIAVARAVFSEPVLPASQEDFEFEFLGLVGFHDPVRPEVPSAIAECHTAGIRVMMMTGDYSGTATQIARAAGLKNPDQVLTGSEIESLNDLELKLRIRTVNVFARMRPAQKLRIVNALKSLGEVTAMTGDGVNDAPSLKWADIGIAMGLRGTDVAREAADLVLLDDCFTSIVTAIRIGRKIFENIQSSVGYIFAIHVPIAGMTMVPAILGMPAALLPAHIVFMELIIDPTCSLIFESLPPDPNTMKRPPRKLGVPLFGRRNFLRNSLQGLFVFAAVFTMYSLSLSAHFTEQSARTHAFGTFVLANLGLIVVSQPRVLRENGKSFFLIAGIAIAILAATVYVPFLRDVFEFSAMGVDEWGYSVGTAFFAVILAYLVRPRNNGQKQAF